MRQGQMTIDKALEGGCLCGAVRYEVTGIVMQSGYCHCRTCQKHSGAPVVAWFAVHPSGFHYISGTPKTYQSSPHARREFCGACGTYLVFRETDPSQTIGINTATLDDPNLVPPDIHIWHSRRIRWFATDDDLPRFDEGSIEP